MRALAIAALAAAIIFSGSPALAQAPVDSHPGAVAQAPIPAGTPEYDAFHAMMHTTYDAALRYWLSLRACKTWVCISKYSRRVDNVLTTGIQWMYTHPALPCYQEKQQRVTKGFQEERGAFRLLYRALREGIDWKIKVANRKIDRVNEIFDNLPAQTCPA